jgi:hypothetical protein
VVDASDRAGPKGPALSRYAPVVQSSGSLIVFPAGSLTARRTSAAVFERVYHYPGKVSSMPTNASNERLGEIGATDGAATANVAPNGSASSA